MSEDKKPPDNGWSKWENYVIKMLDKNDDDHAAILGELKTIGRKVAVLEVKAGVWGAIAGVVATIGTMLIALALGAF